jgi:hypothetical protein
MFQAKAEKASNLLRVVYAERVGPDEMKRGMEKLQQALADLAPGFLVLTDLSGLQEMDLACAPIMKRMMELCDKKGVARVIRVIPDPRKDIGFNIMSIFHFRRRVRISTCETMKEALRQLGGQGQPAQGKTPGEPTVGKQQLRR